MRQKLTAGYVLTFLALILLLTILNASLYINRQGVFATIPLDYLIIGISIAIILGLIVNGFLVRLLLNYIEKESELNAQMAYFESTNDLFQTIKSQRHDFNNHVQVLYGMISENLIDAVKVYIKDVFKETKEINEIVVVDRPEIAALFRAKSSKAALSNLQLKINVNCKLSGLSIKPHELVRIIGNLLDNAIEATEFFNTQQKEVSIYIYKHDSIIFIETINPGDLPEDSESLFVPGISKKIGHSGLGLYIVKKIVENYNGNISFESYNGSVRFIVSLPM